MVVQQVKKTVGWTVELKVVMKVASTACLMVDERVDQLDDWKVVRTGVMQEKQWVDSMETQSVVRMVEKWVYVLVVVLAAMMAGQRDELLVKMTVELMELELEKWKVAMMVQMQAVWKVDKQDLPWVASQVQMMVDSLVSPRVAETVVMMDWQMAFGKAEKLVVILAVQRVVPSVEWKDKQMVGKTVGNLVLQMDDMRADLRVAQQAVDLAWKKEECWVDQKVNKTVQQKAAQRVVQLVG